MNGEIEEIVSALTLAEQAEAMEKEYNALKRTRFELTPQDKRSLCGGFF